MGQEIGWVITISFEGYFYASQWASLHLFSFIYCRDWGTEKTNDSVKLQKVVSAIGYKPKFYVSHPYFAHEAGGS